VPDSATVNQNRMIILPDFVKEKPAQPRRIGISYCP
jgi:hypothetical protein